VPAWVATASAIVLQIASIGTGAAVVAATGSSLLATQPGFGPALVTILIAAVVSFGLLLSPSGLERLVRRVGHLSEFRAPRAGPVLVGVALNGVAWVAYGIALYWLAGAILPRSELSLVQAIGAFTASYLAGFLFLLAPGGLGVREMVFVLMTQATVGPAQALVLAAASRLGMTAADLAAALPFVIRRRKTGDRA
jgi:hypothetical protein